MEWTADSQKGVKFMRASTNAYTYLVVENRREKGYVVFQVDNETQGILNLGKVESLSDGMLMAAKREEGGADANLL